MLRVTSPARVPDRCAGGGAPGLACRLPPQSFFLVSAVFHYLGPSLAVLLFNRVSVLGVAWLRIVTAALVFAVWRRPWRLASRLDRRGLRVLLALGAVLAGMNSLFYLAIGRLPLSTVGRSSSSARSGSPHSASGPGAMPPLWRSPRPGWP